MKNFLPTIVLASIGSLPLVSAPTQTHAYQIDCAILLCLSGGWPASAPCSAAYAEFIRRITPWPIEPPLQIWRCPMSMTYDGQPPANPLDQLYDIMGPANPQMSFPAPGTFDAAFAMDDPDFTDMIKPTLAIARSSGGSAMPEDIRLYLAQSVGTGADIDVSDPAFDFVRSIDVFQVALLQREINGRDDSGCIRSQNVTRGTYDSTGQFTWRSSNTFALPNAFVGDERFPSNCPTVRTRAIFVDWTDYEGNYGFEQVNY